MKIIKNLFFVGLITISTLSWGIDEHRPIQGGTTNPNPTGPTDVNPTQDPQEDQTDNAIVPSPTQVPMPRVRKTPPRIGGMRGSTGSGASMAPGTGANMQSGGLGGGTSGSTGSGTYTGTTSGAKR